jgi:hypothetical protein
VAAILKEFQVLNVDNEWKDASQGGVNWAVYTSNYTAEPGDGIVADTSGGSFTVTLPAAPVTGDTIVIADGANWSTNSLIVARNGSTIEDYADDLELDVAESRVEFVYSGTTWQVYTLGTTNFSIDQWLFKDADYVASADDKIIADTSNGAFTITLPSGPYIGAHVYIADGGDFSTTPLIVDAGLNTIDNTSNTFSIDVSTQIDFIYDGTTWDIVVPVAPIPGSGNEAYDQFATSITYNPGATRAHGSYIQNEAATADVAASVDVSSGFTKVKIELDASITNITDATTEIVIALERTVNGLNATDVKQFLFPPGNSFYGSQHFTYIDTHGAAVGDTIEYKLRVDMSAYANESARCQFGICGDTLFIKEIA